VACASVARVSDQASFEAQVAPFRGELRAYCYRLLGSMQDADDALQEALLGAWRGLPGFEGRSALRSWLYTIATHACTKVIAQRPPRQLSIEVSGPTDGVELEPMGVEPIWLEPYRLEAGASYELKESVEIAFVAALQHLPATQRAALILCNVLGFDAAEAAPMLGTTIASLNSALQRARATMEARGPKLSQQATRRALGVDREQALVADFVSAWERSDVSAIVALLTRDAKFSMPPIPNWFHGPAAIGRFFGERIFEMKWRLTPTEASGQLALLCRQGPSFNVGAIAVLTIEGASIAQITGFLDPKVHARFL
jgi:RNA polymerase sigma-70 factor (TIGR02960 family)